VKWNWFKFGTRRVFDLADHDPVIESWISQSRDPVAGEDSAGPVTAPGVVLDV